MKLQVKLSSGIGNKAAAARDGLDRLVSDRIQNVVRNIHNQILRSTPVWSGRGIANYHWSNDGAVVTRQPVRSTPKPGEERRDANRKFADESRRQLVYNRKIFLTNGARYPDGKTFADLEYGRLPTPDSTRVSPQGIMRLAFSRYSKRIVLNSKNFWAE